MFRQRAKFVLTTILGTIVIPLVMNVVTGGTLIPLGPAWIVFGISGGGFILIQFFDLIKPEKRSAEESPSAFPTQKPGTRDVRTYQSVSSTPLLRGTPFLTKLLEFQRQSHLWRAVSQGLDEKDVLRRVRWRIAPSSWRMISLSSLSNFVWPIIWYGCVWGLVGVAGTVLLSCLSINVVDELNNTHGFFLKIDVARYAIPDWPVWIWMLIGAIGVTFGSIVGWARREEKFLALLPDGFVYGNTGPGWVYAANFHHVAAIDVVPSQNVLWITPHGSSGEKMSVIIPTDPDTLRSIVDAYERFKASSSV